MRTQWLKFVMPALVAAALAACGGGGGGSGPAAGSATVGVLLTDAPVGQWDEAIATITSVELIGEGGNVELFRGSQTLDLLKLVDFSEVFAVSDDVPPGTYNKIRLRLSDLVLNDIDPETGAVIDSEQPQLVGNGKLDLNPRGSFVLHPGDTVFVELDFDMEKSLKITETGNGKLIVRPVVFVDIHADHHDGRLSRVHGEITELGPKAGDFRLCQSIFVSQWDDDGAGEEIDADDRRCLTVSTDEATGIFGEDGLPATVADLAAGEEVTVVGRLRALAGEEEGDDDRLVFALDAFVIEEGPLGTFRRVLGSVASAVDFSTSRFGLDVAAGQGIATDAPLPVQLFDQSRVFSRDGDELGRDAIVTDRIALVDGVLAIGDDDVLRSPLVMLGDAVPGDMAAIAGAVVSVDAAQATLLVNDGTMDRCIRASGADVFIVDDSDGLETSLGELSDLVSGQSVSVFGTEELDGCLVADTIIAEALP